MKHKIWFNFIKILLVVELASLITQREFLTLRAQSINSLFILFFFSFILIEKKLKSEKNKILIGNIYSSLILFTLLGISIFAVVNLYPLVNKPFTDSMGIIILMIIIGAISLINLFNIWIRYFRKDIIKKSYN